MSKKQEIISDDSDTRHTLLIRAGRGNSGGTTALNAAIELALAEGRNPVILDAARNPSLSALYPGRTIRPESHAIGDIKEAMTSGVLDVMIEESRPGVWDMGGGQDDTLIEYMLDLNLVEFCKSVNIRPVFMVTFGPQPDDFMHALEIKRRGIFDGADVLLIQNEGVLRRGQEPRKVFEQIQESKEFVDWIISGARPLYMTTLPCMDAVRSLGLSLNEAALNKPNQNGNKIGITKSWIVKDWLNKFSNEFIVNKCENWRV